MDSQSLGILGVDGGVLDEDSGVLRVDGGVLEEDGGVLGVNGGVLDEDGGVLGVNVRGEHLVGRDLLDVLVGGGDLEVGLEVVFPGDGEDEDHIPEQDVGDVD